MHQKTRVQHENFDGNKLVVHIHKQCDESFADYNFNILFG